MMKKKGVNKNLPLICCAANILERCEENYTIPMWTLKILYTSRDFNMC